MSGLRTALYLVPGNHDIGDKVISWAPAGCVCQAYLDRYEDYHGAHFYAFDVNDFHFVVVNALVLNSGLAAETKQRAWLEMDLAAHAQKRIFVFIHYPPFVSDPEERSSYDNIDEPACSWLLDLVRKARTGGHVLRPRAQLLV